MSKRELNRLEIIQQLQNKQLTQIDAAKYLKISTRQLLSDQLNYPLKFGTIRFVNYRIGKWRIFYKGVKHGL